MEAVRLSRFEQLPWRRIILVILGIVVIGVVGIGATKTLTLGKAEGGYSGGAWRDFVVQGAAQGAIYAMIALGYSLVYGILRMINFAHGEVFMAGSFGSFFVARTLDTTGPTPEASFLNQHPIASIAILLVVSMAVSMFVAILLERIAYRPLRNAPRLVPLITAIGASLFLQNTARGFFGAQSRG